MKQRVAIKGIFFPYIVFMISQFLSCLFWICQRASNKDFYRVCNSYAQEKKSDIFVVIETRSDPGNLKRDFSRLGFNGFDFSESKGFAGRISMGLKTGKSKVQI